MLKLWLVTFSNGEEWYIFGEYSGIFHHCRFQYGQIESITFVRAYRR